MADEFEMDDLSRLPERPSRVVRPRSQMFEEPLHITDAGSGGNQFDDFGMPDMQLGGPSMGAPMGGGYGTMPLSPPGFGDSAGFGAGGMAPPFAGGAGGFSAPMLPANVGGGNENDVVARNQKLEQFIVYMSFVLFIGLIIAIWVILAISISNLYSAEDRLKNGSYKILVPGKLPPNIPNYPTVPLGFPGRKGN